MYSSFPLGAGNSARGFPLLLLTADFPVVPPSCFLVEMGPMSRSLRFRISHFCLSHLSHLPPFRDLISHLTARPSLLGLFSPCVCFLRCVASTDPGIPLDLRSAFSSQHGNFLHRGGLLTLPWFFFYDPSKREVPSMWCWNFLQLRISRVFFRCEIPPSVACLWLASSHLNLAPLSDIGLSRPLTTSCLLPFLHSRFPVFYVDILVPTLALSRSFFFRMCLVG